MLCIPLSAQAWKMEAQSVDLPATSGQSQSFSFSFQQTYDTPPIVVSLATDDGSQPGALRISNVTTTGFQIAQVEPFSEDGPHAAMTVSYVAVEPGTHTLPDGRTIEAGEISSRDASGSEDDYVQYNGRQAARKNWFSLTFSRAFSQPVLLSDIQTLGNEPGLQPRNPSIPWLTVAVQNLTSSGVDLALERGEAYDRQAGPNYFFDALAQAESIGYIVMDGNTQGSFRAIGNRPINYETVFSSNAVVGWDDNCNNINFSGTYTSTPVAVATKSSHNEIDGGWLRQCSLNSSRIQLTVDEDEAQDSERRHTSEDVSVVLFSESFVYDSNAAGLAESETLMLEADSAALVPDQFTRINFRQVYEEIPAVFVLGDDGNPEPSSVRIRNVTTSGFDVIPVEPPNSTPELADQNTSIHYLAIHYGQFQFPDGTRVEVSRFPVANFQSKLISGDNWLRFNYQSAFPATPAVLTQIQTMNNEAGHTPGNPSAPWMTVAMQDVDSAGADIALDRAETTSGTITQSENIAYLAIEAGTIAPFQDVSGSTILSEAIRSSDSIAGTTNCDTVNFSNSYSDAPLVVGSQVSRDGGDGGWLRRCSVSNTRTDIKIEEDWDNDRDRSHTTEQANLMVFSEAFAADFSLLANYQLEGPSWNGSAAEVDDSSGNALNGSASGDARAFPAQVCNGAELDGNGDDLTIADDPLLDIEEELTVMAWINADSLPGSDLMTIVSKDTNYEFHLDSSGRIYWWWEMGTGSRSFDTDPFQISLNTWHHIAIVYSRKSGTQRIYVDGIERASESYSNESLQTNDRPFYIGVDDAYPSRAFDGQIDEVKVFERALPAAAIQHYRDETRPCPSCILGDFTITQPSYALACPATRAQVDLSARCVDGTKKEDYVGTIQLSGPSGAEFYDAASNGNAITSYTFSLSDQGDQSVFLYFDDENSDVRTTVNDSDAGVSSTAQTGTDFRTSGFRVSAEPADFQCGDTTSFTLQAYGQTDNTTGGQCEVLSGFSGNKSLDVWFSATTDDDGSADTVSTPLVLNGQSITTQQSSDADANLSVDFSAGEASITAGYANAAQILGIDVRFDQPPYDGSVFGNLLASTSAFVARPERLDLAASRGATALNTNTANGSPVHPASDPFELAVQAYCSDNSPASDYQPTADSNRVMAYARRTGPTGGSSVEGQLQIATGKTLTTATSGTPVWESADLPGSQFVNGRYRYADANYSEVGLVQLFLQDQDYFGTQIDATPLDIGRFIPKYFDVTVDSGSLQAYCTPATGNPFSYIGQSFAYSSLPGLNITARNSADQPTQNYTETGYLKLTPADINRTHPDTDRIQTGSDGTTLMPVISTAFVPAGFDSASAGAISYRFDAADRFVYTRGQNTQIEPFTSLLDITINAVADADGVTASASPFTLTPVGIELAYGRWKLENAFGPETSSLAIPLMLEYWDGDRFRVHSADSCTPFDSAQLSLTPNLSNGGTTTASGGGTLDSGTAPIVSAITLSAPGTGRVGNVELSYQGDTWLRFDWDNDPGTADTDPIGSATFGQYRGNDRIIYWREVSP